MLNTSAVFKSKVYDGIRKFHGRATIHFNPYLKYFRRVRYIRNWTNGSTANTGNYWIAVKAISGETDRARGILPTSNAPTLNNPMNITDGNDTTYGNAWTGKYYVQVDLGQVFEDIEKIQIIHFYADSRIFADNVTEISEDGVNWTVLYDSEVDGRYVSTAEGLILYPSNESTTVYDDETIMSMKILDEMSVLNDSLPSNELELIMNNTNGDFDFLNVENMQSILASKPTIKTELGLVLLEAEAQTIISNFLNKKSGSFVENGNSAFRYGSGDLLEPSKFSTELDDGTSLTGYDKLQTLNTAYAGQSAGAGTAGRRGQHLFRFDIIRILTDHYGNGIWQNATTTSQKVVIARELLKRVAFRWWGYGTHEGGYEANISIATASGIWSTSKKHTSASRTFLEIPTTSFSTFIGWDGIMHFNAYSAPSTATGNSVIWTDYCELEIEMNDIESVEWLPTGTFFLTHWNNEITNKIVTLIGHDYFTLLSEINYEPTGITNLRSLAIDVLTKGGVPIGDQLIDASLSQITVNPFPERLDIRSALQFIGIAARSAVGQDRNGKVYIKPFRTLDEATNYITYPTIQNGLYTFPGPGMYALNDSGGGMKYLDFDNMFEAPKVSLEKSIYQLVIRVYSGGTTTDRVYTNSFIEGTNGESFTIDNPLIKTTSHADQIAEWFFKETNYNAKYSVRWRQNPALECADIVLVEDSFNAEKQSRVTKTEFTYQGYLEGVIESRGGV